MMMGARRFTGTHAMTMTLKSSQFQGSLKNVNFPKQKPRAKILTRDSNV